MDEEILKEFLPKVEIFSELGTGEIDALMPYLDHREYGVDDVLFQEGDQGKELFIVIDGTVSTSVRMSDGMGREVALFDRGNFFGEMSIFEDAPRSATCRIKDESRLLTMKGNDFFLFAENNPRAAVKIMYRMLNITALRLSHAGEFLEEMVHWGEAARKRAITDEFTGAYNRRFLEDSLEGYVEKARKTGLPLTMVMVDLDYFRQINDGYTPEIGDQCILEVVKVFNDCLREGDILARYGGDEFTVILPDTDPDTAFEVVERVRQEVGKLDLLDQLEGPDIRLSLSQGLATFPDHVSDLKQLKEKTDQSLYEAKERGRNRVFRASDLGD